MPMTDSFRNLIALMTVGSAFTPFNNANAHVGVGDSGAVFNSAHNELQGTNKVLHPMRPDYPTRNDNVLVFYARFLEEDANFHWLEGCVTNSDNPAGADHIMMCRFLDDQGVKPSDQIWDYEVTITVAHGS